MSDVSESHERQIRTVKHVRNKIQFRSYFIMIYFVTIPSVTRRSKAETRNTIKQFMVEVQLKTLLSKTPV